MSDIKGVFNFKYGGGVAIKDGKAYWPHTLYLSIPRNLVSTVVHDLIEALEHGVDAELAFSGELTRDAEQDQGNPIEVEINGTRANNAPSPENEQ